MVTVISEKHDSWTVSNGMDTGLLDPACYTSEERFAQIRDKVFAKSWFCNASVMVCRCEGSQKSSSCR